MSWVEMDGALWSWVEVDAFVPCGYVLIQSNVSNLFSSSLLSAILLTSSVYTL